MAFILAGLALLAEGGELLVRGAVNAAQALGVSPLLVGLTIVGFGTSTPELVACVIAALRRHAEVAVGNAIGSNIDNVFGILGLTAIVHPIAVPPEIARLDIWVLVAATARVILFLRSGWTLRRSDGGVLVAAYAGYVAYLLTA